MEIFTTSMNGLSIFLHNIFYLSEFSFMSEINQVDGKIVKIGMDSWQVRILLGFLVIYKWEMSYPSWLDELHIHSVETYIWIVDFDQGEFPRRESQSADR